MTTEVHSQEGLRRMMPASLSEIDVVCSDMKTWLADRGLGHEQFGVTLLAREAMVNAVVHGVRTDATQKIDVRLDLREDHLVLSVEDPGPGFDWRASVDGEANLSEDHGRGMMIFRSYASDIRYSESGNKITLRKKVDPRRKQ